MNIAIEEITEGSGHGWYWEVVDGIVVTFSNVATIQEALDSVRQVLVDRGIVF